MGESAARAAPAVSVLREGFAGVSTRFHLVGFYTLAALLLRFLDILKLEDTALLPLLVVAVLVFQGVVSGVLGVLFLDATGRREPASFARSAAVLFVPVLWLSVKITVIIYGLAAAAAVVAMIATGRQEVQEMWTSVKFWGGPGFGLATQVLALYSLPLCIQSRLDGVRRASIRDGARFLRSRPAESAWLALVLLGIACLGGALHYARGPEGAAAEPDVAETLILFASSYLSLVTFFAAARVILHPRPAAGGVLPGHRDAAAPGPPA